MKILVCVLSTLLTVNVTCGLFNYRRMNSSIDRIVKINESERNLYTKAIKAETFYTLYTERFCEIRIKKATQTEVPEQDITELDKIEKELQRTIKERDHAQETFNQVVKQR